LQIRGGESREKGEWYEAGRLIPLWISLETVVTCPGLSWGGVMELGTGRANEAMSLPQANPGSHGSDHGTARPQ